MHCDNASRAQQHNICEVNLLNCEKRFNKRYTCVRSPNNNNSSIIVLFDVVQIFSSNHRQRKWSFFFILRISIHIDTSFIFQSSFKIFMFVLKIPFSFEQMGENSHSQRCKLIENIRQKCSIMHFEIKTSFVCESHNFSQDKPHRFYEQRIN